MKNFLLAIAAMLFFTTAAEAQCAKRHHRSGLRQSTMAPQRGNMYNPRAVHPRANMAGRTTRTEKMRIANQSRSVREAKQMARADGFVSPQERRIIQRKNQRLNQTIRSARY